MYASLTAEEKQKKRENLIAITNWCKDEIKESFGSDMPITIKNVFIHNNRSYSVSVSMATGFSVCGDGRYSQWTRVYDDDQHHDNNLIDHTVGTEVISKWPTIKNAIIKAINDRKNLHNAMMSFQV